MYGKASGNRGRPALLDAEAIAETALAIADREGLDALSMRRLASDLGVATMTVYNYFPTKDALLEAMVDIAVSEPEPAVAGIDGWRSQLTAMLLAVRANLQRHPALVELRLRRPILRPEALRFSEQALVILTGAGLPPDDAARCFRLLFVYVFGFAALSPADRYPGARDEARAAIGALDPERYPALTAVADTAVDAMGGDAQFAHGVELVLDGIAARMS